MSWSDRVMASLDQRAMVLETARGDAQIARAGHGPPVIVSHGGPGGFDQGLAWCAHLRADGCELLAPSRPGYLRTPLESGRRPEDQADLFAAILDALDIERAAVVGFSSGGPAAVQFAARHPTRTTALLLDAPVLLPFVAPIGALRQATLESSLSVWLSYELVGRKPELMARFMVDGVSDGLSREQKQLAASWITSDAGRLRSMQEQFKSAAPRRFRKHGWDNDQTNERQLTPLPFNDVAAPTVIAFGANDAIVPAEHATSAADAIAGAEMIRVEEGHHLLSLSRHYGPIARRQLELARS